MNISKSLNDYFSYLSSQKYSTKKEYYNDAIKFINFTGHKPIEEINFEVIIDFINYLQNSVSKRRQKRIIACLKKFFSFLEQEGYLLWNPFALVRISLIEQEDVKPYVPSREEISAIAELFESNESFQTENCLFQLIINTGARYESIVTLQKTNVNFDRQEILLTNVKNKREVCYKLHERVFDTLVNYLNNRRKQVNIFEVLGYDDDYVFCQYNFRKPKTFTKTLRITAAKAGVENSEKMNINTLRRVKATLVTKELGLEAAQKAMRHQNARSTFRYVGVAWEELEQTLAKNPFKQIIDQKLKGYFL